MVSSSRNTVKATSVSSNMNLTCSLTRSISAGRRAPRNIHLRMRATVSSITSAMLPRIWNRGNRPDTGDGGVSWADGRRHTTYGDGQFGRHQVDDCGVQHDPAARTHTQALHTHTHADRSKGRQTQGQRVRVGDKTAERKRHRATGRRVQPPKGSRTHSRVPGVCNDGSTGATGGQEVQAEGPARQHTRQHHCLRLSATPKEGQGEKAAQTPPEQPRRPEAQDKPQCWYTQTHVGECV